MSQQKGLFAFFKRSPAVDSKAEVKKTNVDSKSSTTRKPLSTPTRKPLSTPTRKPLSTPTRKPLSTKRTNEEEESEENEFTPVLKSKKRRVIIDSDEEEVQDEAASPKCDSEKAGNGDGLEEEGAEPMEGLVSGQQQENGLEKMVDAETEDGDKTSGMNNGVATKENGMETVERGVMSAVTSTPPKRRTARKHTGKVWSTPRHSGDGRALQDAGNEEPPTSAMATNTTTTTTTTATTAAVAEVTPAKEDKVNKEEIDEEEKAERTEETREPAEEVKETSNGEEMDAPGPKCKKADSADAARNTPTAKVSKVAASKATPSNSKPPKGEKKKKGEGNTTFNPAQPNYHPVEDAPWQRGQKVPYLALARTFELIEEESKRLKIIATLTNFFRSVLLLSPEEMVQCVYLCLNKLAPAYEGLELGIGESILMKAIAEATGRSVKQIKNEAVTKGDLGIVAEASRSNQRMMFAPPKLTVSGVFTKLKAIAAMTGNSSMAKKVNIIKGLFTACRHSEARYLIRSLGGKLRIGLAEQSVLVAIAHAAVRTPPGQVWPAEVLDGGKGCSSEHFQKQLEEATLTIKTCYCEHPNYEVLLSALISHGVSSLHQHCHLTSGIPLKPMLAHPTKGIREVLQRFESADFTCEWKYDGERAQIHVLEGGEIRVYSRNSENNTSKYPDIIARMPKVLKDSVSSCIIDAEAVAWDVEKQQILPFQVLSTRKRKDAEMTEIKVQVCVYAFDLLFYNGKSLVKEPLKARREMLREAFNEIEGEFKIATSMDTTSIEEIQEFLDESIKGNCEGLMVKTLEKNATYEIARRSHNWLKLKKDYLEGVGDTLDLVVLGGFHGTGKRTGKYGGFLLACYDEENEEYQVICKIGTGFKDEDLEAHASFFKEHVLEGPKPYYRHSEGIRPDHWFEAVQVWEVKAADLSISPVYAAAAGIVDPEKGISLRFPRFLRIREDKKPEEATSCQQVASMYCKQQNVSGETADPEEFY